jgi:hypothetical protein
MSVRFEMRVDEALMARVDRARGDDETRAAWIKRAIEIVLDIRPGQVVRRQVPEAERIVKDAAVAANRAIPRRAPAADGVGHFVFPASALVNESEAEREARAEVQRAIGARQAKLNAAKAGQPKRKES